MRFDLYLRVINCVVVLKIKIIWHDFWKRFSKLEDNIFSKVTTSHSIFFYTNSHFMKLHILMQKIQQKFIKCKPLLIFFFLIREVIIRKEKNKTFVFLVLSFPAVFATQWFKHKSQVQVTDRARPKNSFSATGEIFLWSVGLRVAMRLIKTVLNKEC